jgi:hypothetical protein
MKTLIASTLIAFALSASVAGAAPADTMRDGTTAAMTDTMAPAAAAPMMDTMAPAAPAKK